MIEDKASLKAMKTEEMRIKALSLLGGEVQRLLNSLTNNIKTNDKIDNEILNILKNQKLEFDEVEFPKFKFDVLKFLPQPLKDILPKTIKNDGFKIEVNRKFDSFYRWISDDYADIKPQEVTVENDSKSKVTIKDDIDYDMIPQPSSLFNLGSIAKFGIIGGIVGQTINTTPTVKPSQSNINVSQDNNIQENETQIKQTYDDPVFKPHMEVLSKEASTDVGVTFKKVLPQNIQDNVKVIDNINVKQKDVTVGDVGKLNISSDLSSLGKISYSTWQVPEISNHQTSNSGDIKIDSKKFKPQLREMGETSFTIMQFNELFEKISRPYVEKYYMFQNEVIWKNDKKSIISKLNEALETSNDDKLIVSKLADEYFTKIENDLPTTDFTVDNIEMWNKKMNSTDSVSNIKTNTEMQQIEKDYISMEQTRTTKTITIDDKDIVPANDIFNAYKIWELSALNHYATWGVTKQDRIDMLDKHFKTFWKKILSTYKNKKLNSIYNYIYNTHYNKIKNNLIKNDRDEILTLKGTKVTPMGESGWKKAGVTPMGGSGWKKAGVTKSQTSIVQKGWNYVKALTGIYPTLDTSRVNMSGVDKSVLSNLISMSEEANKLGLYEKIPLNSAFRDYKDQVRLWNENVDSGKLEASLPFVSPHAFGIAFDINRGILNELDKYGLLEKYRFDRPYMKGESESWHLQSIDATVEYDKIITQGDNAKFLAIKSAISSGQIKNFKIPTGLTEKETREWLLNKYDEIYGNTSSTTSSTTTKTSTTTSQNSEVKQQDTIQQLNDVVEIFKNRIVPAQVH